jgi:hypothetical protein
MNKLLARIGMAAFCVVSLLAASCSRTAPYQRLPTTGASLEGTVRYGQEKVPAALLIVAGKGGSATGHVDADGHYEIDNVPLGEVAIAVNTAAARAEAMARQGKAAAKIVNVPARYQDPVKSGIKTTVTGGANTFDIVIPRG